MLAVCCERYSAFSRRTSEGFFFRFPRDEVHFSAGYVFIVLADPDCAGDELGRACAAPRLGRVC